MPINGLREAVIEYASAVVFAAAEAYLADAVSAAPERTGALKQSAYGPTVSWAGETIIRATVGFEAPQADYTDQGTAPHIIHAVNASVLRFYWEDGPDGPGWYAFPSVNHPGSTNHVGWFTDREQMWEDYVQAADEEGGAAWAPPTNSMAS